MVHFKKMDALNRLDKGESLQKIRFRCWKFNNQRLEKKLKGHSVIFHDSRGRNFIGVS
jgi:hypothetical protein